MTATDPMVLAGSLLELGRELHRAAAGKTSSDVVLQPAQLVAVDRRLQIAASRAKALSAPISTSIKLLAATVGVCQGGMTAQATRDLARSICAAGSLIVVRAEQQAPAREVAG